MWSPSCRHRKLEVQLPRFLLGGAYSLKDVLTQMDVKDVFQDTADLSIAPEEGLRLTEVRRTYITFTFRVLLMMPRLADLLANFN